MAGSHKLEKSGIIKLDEEISDKEIWRLISEKIIPQKEGKVILPLTGNKEGKATLEIQGVISDGQLPLLFTDADPHTPQLTPSQAVSLRLLKDSIYNICNSLFKSSWILLGALKLHTGKVIPILIVHIDSLDVNWFSILEIDVQKALMDYQKNFN